MAALPSMPGVYALILEADRCLEVTVGKFGTLDVQPGYYAYIGSALGPGGLAARLKRHFSRDKLLRWHIDYLTVQLWLLWVLVVVFLWLCPGVLGWQG